MEQNEFEGAEKRSKSVLNEALVYTDEELPNKQELLATLYALSGSALMQLDRFSEAEKQFLNDFDISETKLVLLLHTLLYRGGGGVLFQQIQGLRKERFIKENLFCLCLYYRYQNIINDVFNLILLYFVFVNTNMYSRRINESL